jgi:hypothetical protein
MYVTQTRRSRGPLAHGFIPGVAIQIFAIVFSEVFARAGIKADRRVKRAKRTSRLVKLGWACRIVGRQGRTIVKNSCMRDNETFVTPLTTIYTGQHDDSKTKTKNRKVREHPSGSPLALYVMLPWKPSMHVQLPGTPSYPCSLQGAGITHPVNV